MDCCDVLLFGLSFLWHPFTAEHRAGRYIACDCHAHLVSKAGSDKLCNIAFVIADDSPSIMNAILCSLSVNYGSV